MATLEERVAALEQTIASLQDPGQGAGLIKDIADLSHNQLLLLVMGLTARTDINKSKVILSRLEQDVNELKRSLDRVEEHTGNIEQRLSSLESRVKNFEQSTSARFDTFEQRMNARFEAQEQRMNARFETQDKVFAARDKKLNQMLLLLTALAPKSEREE